MTYRLLDGVRVIEFGNMVSAPFCAKILGDLGAEVIKIEDPDGGDKARRREPYLNDIPGSESSGPFLYHNLNRLGITLNLRTATGKQILPSWRGQGLDPRDGAQPTSNQDAGRTVHHPGRIGCRGGTERGASTRASPSTPSTRGFGGVPQEFPLSKRGGGAPMPRRCPDSALGQHNDYVFGEMLGMLGEEIARLVE